MTDNTYNGWKNYQTWAVGMYLDGNYDGEGRYHDVIQVVSDVYPTEESGRRYLVADALREYVSDTMPDLGSSIAADLLGAALSDVDWYELADAWIENVQEQVAS